MEIQGPRTTWIRSNDPRVCVCVVVVVVVVAGWVVVVGVVVGAGGVCGCGGVCGGVCGCGNWGGEERAWGEMEARVTSGVMGKGGD